MSTLVRKDVDLALPLVKAIWIGMIGLQLIMLMIGASMQLRERIQIHLGLWMLMPNLLSLGLPAMLVGGEEENGTLAWLRTLPISWRWIVGSKFLVSAIALLVTWLGSTLLVATILSDSIVAKNRYEAGLLSSFGPLSSAHVAFLSFVLLTVGFALAYLFRSPIVALIVFVPVVALAYQITTWGTNLLISGSILNDKRHSSTGQLVLLVAAGVAFLGALWWIQNWLGGRRMKAAPKNRRGKVPLNLSTFAYRPAPSVGMSRPSALRALLWQQWQQVGIPVVLLTGLAIFFLLLMSQIGKGDWVWAFGPLITMSSATILGAICFYSDSVRRRCGYFADRGISPSMIWATRLAAPGSACLIIAILTAIVARVTPEFPMLQWPSVLVVFAVGQLVSMWVKRPVLSFFATPVLALAVIIPMFWLYVDYPQYGWVTALASPFFLFATWWLQKRWLENRMGLSFHSWAVTLSVVAACLPFSVFAAHRIATTPREQTEWRQRAMNASHHLAKQFKNAGRPLGYTDAVMTDTQAWHRAAMTAFRDNQTIEQYHERLLLELDSLRTHDRLQHVSVDELRSGLHGRFKAIDDPSKAPVIRAATVRTILAWANRLRITAREGNLPLSVLELLAEQMESEVASVLTNQSMSFNFDEVPELVAMISPSELRRDSRKVALLRDWRAIEEAKQYSDQFGYITFLNDWVLLRSNLLFFENTRTYRNIDLMVQKLWSDLENGLPGEQSAGGIWKQDLPAQHPVRKKQQTFFKNWTSRYETQIANLRKRFPQR